MNKLSILFITLISAITLTLAGVSSSFAKVEGDYIVLGSAISLTGKYSSISPIVLKKNLDSYL